MQSRQEMVSRLCLKIPEKSDCKGTSRLKDFNIPCCHVIHLYSYAPRDTYMPASIVIVLRIHCWPTGDRSVQASRQWIECSWRHRTLGNYSRFIFSHKAARQEKLHIGCALKHHTSWQFGHGSRRSCRCRRSCRNTKASRQIRNQRTIRLHRHARYIRDDDA